MSNTKLLRKCYLKCIKNSHPPIELGLDKVFVGRSRETNIQDSFCSRKQVCLKANLDEGYVLIKPIGANPSALNGFVMEMNEPYEAIHGDILEIIHDKYFHEVVFDPEILPKESFKRTLPSNKSVSVTSPKKIKVEESKMMDSATETLPSDKSVSVTSPKKIKVEENKMLDSATETTESSWESMDNGKLYIYTSKGVSSREKIASYDMDGTLIKTMSGKVFPKDTSDWQIIFSEVPGKLKSLHANGFKIVIFTNQAGISTGKTSIKDFKIKIERICSKLSVPIQAFVSTGKGVYRKPMIGMWNHLCSQQLKDNVPVSLSKSFYIGDAAGRPELKNPVKRKKDHSSADRLMALNVGIQFYTPEEHFLNGKIVEWIEPEFDPRNLQITDSITQPPTAKITSNSLEVIIMVGSPGSGKSCFAKNYLEKNGYKLINRDKLGSWQKCVQVLQRELNEKNKSVIDNTNPDIESRKRFIDIAKRLNIPVRCFVMNTTYKQSKHNNKFRELTDPTHTPVNDIVLNTFKKNFRQPTVDEGFAEIVQINFIPKFKNSDEEKLYKMFLLES